jgi:hypothetical protein
MPPPRHQNADALRPRKGISTVLAWVVSPLSSPNVQADVYDRNFRSYFLKNPCKPKSLSFGILDSPCK